MCGFIGFITSKNCKLGDTYQKKFQYYFKKQKYRGPDFSESIKINKKNHKICVGFNRLSIQDRSKKGNKIFKSDRYILLFNGEILNFNNLKNKYFFKEKFSSKTDTELLFNFLIKYGDKKINELEGMFAFILIDIEKNTITLCRDYTGIKPLFYITNEDGIFFSSEAWFPYSISNKNLNYFACKFYFQFGFTPKEVTLVENVRKILPSHVMSYNFKNRIITNKKYFNLLKKSKFPKVDFTNLKYDIENVIKKNLITDTKVGIFLSGGIDSTIIAVIAKKFNDNIQAYTSFFSPNSKFKKFNEDYEYSKKICKEFNIKLNKVVIDENNLFQKKELTNALKYLDEPNANLNFFNSFLQSKFAKRDNCKVILTGDGADEIFGGYERYQKTFISEKFSFLNLIFNKIKKINNLKNDEVAKFFYNNINLNNSKKIFSKKFYDEMIFSKKILKNSKKNIKISKIINNFDLIDWLPEESNYKLDRSSMLNSIEARVPFQDKKLIEKYFGIDFKEKIDLLSVKKPLKKLNIIPDYVKKRKKRGWFSPESIFLRHYLEGIFFKTFEKKKILKQGLLNNNEIMKIYNLHKKGSYFKKELITILIFQIWYDQLLKSF